MINEINILAPYFNVSGFQKGDIFAPEGKSVLIRGSNASGKSTFLHMLFESIRIHKSYKQGALLPFASPFWNFHDEGFSTKGWDESFDDGYKNIDSILLDGFPLIASSISEAYADEFPDKEPEGPHYEKFQKAYIKKDLEEYTNEVFPQFFKFPEGNTFSQDSPLDSQYLMAMAVNNPDLFKSVPKISKKVFFSAQKTFYEQINYDRSHEFQLGSVEVYNYMLENLAKEQGVSADYLRGLALMLDTRQLAALPSLGTQYLFMKLDTVPDSVGASYAVPGPQKINRYSTIDSTGKELILDTPKGSLGQKQADSIDNLLGTDSSVILLDEPLANMDETNQDIYTEKLFSAAKDKQLVVVSHDRLFNKEAINNGWYEIKF